MLNGHINVGLLVFDDIFCAEIESYFDTIIKTTVYAIHDVLLCSFIAGAPVIIKQDSMIADSSNVTLSVFYYSEPPLMYIIWYINDENVNESNYSNHSDIFIQNTKVNVAVNYYKTPITMRLCLSQLSFRRAVVSHMDTISCHLKNRIGSREPFFETNMLTITLKNKEISNIIYIRTTELESSREDIYTVSSHLNGEQGKCI